MCSHLCLLSPRFVELSRLSHGFKLKPTCFPTPGIRYDLYRTHPSVLRESISDVEVLGNDVNVIHRLTRSRFLENISGWPSGVLNSGKLGCPRFEVSALNHIRFVPPFGLSHFLTDREMSNGVAPWPSIRCGMKNRNVIASNYINKVADGRLLRTCRRRRIDLPCYPYLSDLAA